MTNQVELPGSAAAAWDAYCAMCKSKESHFAALASLHAAKEQGQQPSLASVAHQEQLLSAHNECVAAFTTAVKKLKQTDAAAHAALLRAMSVDAHTTASKEIN